MGFSATRLVSATAIRGDSPDVGSLGPDLFDVTPPMPKFLNAFLLYNVNRNRLGVLQPYLLIKAKSKLIRPTRNKKLIPNDRRCKIMRVRAIISLAISLSEFIHNIVLTRSIRERVADQHKFLTSETKNNG